MKLTFKRHRVSFVRIELLSQLKILRQIFTIRILRVRQNGNHLANSVFKLIFGYENCCVWTLVPLDLVPKRSLNTKPALVEDNDGLVYSRKHVCAMPCGVFCIFVPRRNTHSYIGWTLLFAAVPKSWRIPTRQLNKIDTEVNIVNPGAEWMEPCQYLWVIYFVWYQLYACNLSAKRAHFSHVTSDQIGTPCR